MLVDYVECIRRVSNHSVWRVGTGACRVCRPQNVLQYQLVQAQSDNLEKNYFVTKTVKRDSHATEFLSIQFDFLLFVECVWYV